ncbi:hypothetical protein F5X68DRAFT_229809 [Plectosphaerella plurivora]|uniref:Uncharacterized protein n=1 Tax=Plectosphaerella plurivora TaxID=936078 RepID=A0A9P9AEU6_9PEZI|nr:hypothetical protein F5X68DRAFT_229809 [Plectosphaerella plurivora]
MELKPVEVENRRQALKLISERIQLYVLGHSDLESKAIYTKQQTAAINGTTGVKLQRAVNNPPVDGFTYKCWIIQAGPETVQDYYLYPCFRGELDAQRIIDIGDIIERGAEAMEAMENWGHGLQNNLQGPTRRSPHHHPRGDVMDKDPMFVMDPIEEGFEFRVRVSAFYHPAPEDITGGGIKDLHFMDRDIVESRLCLLQYIAARQGSWIHEDISQATALVLPKMSNDISILRMILGDEKHSRRMEEVVLPSAVTWMGKPHGHLASKPAQLQAYNELLRIQRVMIQQFPDAMQSIWKGAEYVRQVPLPEQFFNEEAMAERHRQQQLVQARMAQDRHDANMRLAQEQQAAEQRRIEGQNAMDRHNAAIIECYDAINGVGGEYMENPRWCTIVLSALDAGQNPAQPFRAGKLDLLDNPDMMNNLTQRQRQLFSDVIQRRRDFAQAASDIGRHNARPLPDSIIVDLQALRRAYINQRADVLHDNSSGQGLALLITAIEEGWAARGRNRSRSPRRPMQRFEVDDSMATFGLAEPVLWPGKAAFMDQ